MSVRRQLFLCLAAGLAACSSDKSVAPPPPVAAIVVTPGADTLWTLGRTRQFIAQPRDASGNPISGQTVVWRSSNAGVATVDSVTGLVTAVGNGLSVISAHLGGVAGQANLAVSQVVASVVLTPPTASFTAVGDTQRFVAVAKDSGNATVANVRFLWGSSNGSAATVDTLGLATSRGSGQATISATGRGVPGYANVSVAQSGVRLHFSIAPPDSVVLGQSFSHVVQVEVRDANNALVTGSRLPISLGLAPGTGSILGTDTVNAVGGIASFPGIILAGPIGGYRLTAEALGLTPDTSGIVKALAGAPARLVFLEPISLVAGDPQFVILTAFDAYGNVATTFSDTVTLTGADLATGKLDTTVATTLIDGEADFDSVIVTEPGHYTLMARTGDVFATAAADAPLSFGGAPSAGVYTACALSTGARAFCWGQGLFGQLGVGGNAVTLKAVLPRLVSGGLSFSSLSVGYAHVCGVTVSGAAYCWGLDNEGQLGDTPLGGSSTLAPVAVAGGHQFAEIATGYLHTCGVTTANDLFCWGDDSRGQLGDAKAAPLGYTGTPVQVGLGTSWAHVTAGASGFSTCGLSVSGAAYCWGANDLVQNGTGHSADDSVPTAVTGGTTFWAINAATDHVCALATADSTAYCWGTNAIGRATVNKDSVAVVVDAGQHYRQLSLTSGKTCGIALGGVYCWVGPASSSLQTPHFDGLWGSPDGIAVGGAFQCEYNLALTKMFCLGNNDYGELGNNTTNSNFTSFVQVYQGPPNVAPAPPR